MNHEHAHEAEPARIERSVIVVFLVAWVVWMGALAWVRYSHPSIDHGDTTTDSNILNAGESWDRDAAAGGGGMWSSYGIPAVDTYRAEGKTPDWYTTYPPGAYWFHQAQKAIGIQAAGGFRAVSVGVSALSVLVLFALVRRMCRGDDEEAGGGALSALAACVLYMTSRPFVEYADSLHYIGLSPLPLFAALYAWTKFEAAETPGAAGGWLSACAAAFFVDSWLTFEHAMFVLAFAAVRCVWLRKPGRLVAVALLGAVPLLALGVRLVMNRAVLGSFGAAMGVMRAKAEQRMGSSASGTGFATLVEVWRARLEWPGAWGPVDGDVAEFAMPLLSWWIGVPLAALGVIALATWHMDGMKPVRRGLGLGVLLLLGGLTWFAVMTEHAIGHKFDAMLIAPGLCVVAGVLVAAGLVQPGFQPRGAPIRWIGRALGVLVIVAWVGSLRSSYAVNTAMRADATVRAAVHRRTDAAASYARAGRAMQDAGVKRLWMFDRDAPTARALGLPFDNLPGGMQEKLGADEAEMVQMWSPASRQGAARGAATLGLPDVISEVSSWSWVVFRAGRIEADRVELVAKSGLRLERMAWRATLDGDAWVLAAVLAGPLEQARGMGAELRVVGSHADGSEVRLGSMGAPAADGTRDGDRALVWMVVARDRLERLTGVELRAVTPGRPRMSGWDVEKSAVAEAAGCEVSERAIRWTRLPWAGGRAGHEPGSVER